MVPGERNFIRPIEPDYRNSLIEQEMKKRVSTSVNTRNENLFDGKFNRLSADISSQNSAALERDRNQKAYQKITENVFHKTSAYYPNLNTGLKDNSFTNFFFDDLEDYNQQTENFFGKKPTNFEPDEYFYHIPDKSTSTPLELSEQFSDNFKNDSNITDSSDNLLDINDERGDTENVVEAKSNAQNGAAWVNFINV